MYLKKTGRKSLLLVTFIMFATLLAAQLKRVETTYLQLPSEGIKYEKVEVYVTLDQSASRDLLGKFGALGKKAAEGVKDITEVYDTWPLVPKFVKNPNKGKGVLRLDLTYSCDDLTKPMTAPPVNQQRGGHVVPYKVYAKVKVTDPSGKVIYDRNYGVLTGEFVSQTYEEANQAKDGLGTYEKACIRGAMAKARAEFFGRYGFSTIDARLDLGPVKDIKESKKASEGVINIFKGKTSFGLTLKEKEIVKSYAQLIEKEVDKCSPKTKWIAYHNLAVCYAWLEDAVKAKEYLEKEYQEVKPSIDKVINFSINRKGGYTGGDGDKFEAYNNIEEFVNYYPSAAAKHRQLLVSLSRPVKQLVDFYANNDLLCSIYGIEYMVDFFPFQKFFTNPKKVTTTITPSQGNPIISKQEFDKSGKIKEVRIESKTDEGKTLETKKLVVDYNPDGSYKSITAKAFLIDKSNLRNWDNPLDRMTKGRADGIIDGGFWGEIFNNNYEELQLTFDMEGRMYIEGNSFFSSADPIMKRFVGDNDIKLTSANTKSEFSALTNLNEQGLIDLSEWKGEVVMTWSMTGAESVTSKVNKNYKITKTDEKGFPLMLNYNYENKAKFKSSKTNWKGIADRFKSYDNLYNEKLSAPKVTTNSFEVQKSQNWPCKYTFDAKGNWITAEIGSIKITREIKY